MSRRLPLVLSAAALFAAALGVIATSQASPARALVGAPSSITVVGPTVQARAVGDSTSAAYCPKGWIATGGGVDISNDNLVVALSSPIVGHEDPLHLGRGRHGRARGWVGDVYNSNRAGITFSFDVAVICTK